MILPIISLLFVWRGSAAGCKSTMIDIYQKTPPSLSSDRLVIALALIIYNLGRNKNNNTVRNNYFSLLDGDISSTGFLLLKLTIAKAHVI